MIYKLQKARITILFNYIIYIMKLLFFIIELCIVVLCAMVDFFYSHILT